MAELAKPVEPRASPVLPIVGAGLCAGVVLALTFTLLPMLMAAGVAAAVFVVAYLVIDIGSRPDVSTGKVAPKKSEPPAVPSVPAADVEARQVRAEVVRQIALPLEATNGEYGPGWVVFYPVFGGFIGWLLLGLPAMAFGLPFSGTLLVAVACWFVVLLSAMHDCANADARRAAARAGWAKQVDASVQRKLAERQRVRDWEAGKAWQALRLRDTLAEDNRWGEAVKADAARVLASLKANVPSHMQEWEVEVGPQVAGDSSPAFGDSVCDQRRQRRAQVLSEATYQVSREGWNMETRVREAAEAARKLKLSQPILLQGSPHGIVFGTDVETGADVVVPVADIPHLLVVGTSGFGKSVFLHQLVAQLVGSAGVGELVLVDLKGGVEFDRYAQPSSKVRVAWEFVDVQATIAHLVALMLERQATMKAQGWRLWRGERVFFIVDEFAQIQLWPTPTKAEKEQHTKMLADLNRLSMLGRAMGIVLVCAIQKPTADVMDSSFRGNLQGQVCFRVPNRLMASAIFPDLDDLPYDPVQLPRGRCLFYNANTGNIHALQVHVAPEARD